MAHGCSAWRPVWSCSAWGGWLRLVAGVAEFHGGWLGRIVARLPEQVGFGAMTLGHAIVGIDQATLCALRAHEHAHARQFEAVGTVFFAGLRVVEFVASRQRPQRPRQQLF